MSKSIEKEFPELHKLFGGYFAGLLILGIPENEIVLNYKNDCLNSRDGVTYLENANKELVQIILHVDDYWEDIIDSANRFFGNSEQAKNWLKMIKRELE